jgi:hypothetical protein
VGGLFVVLFVFTLLFFNRIFSLRLELSFLTQKIWELADEILHLESIAVYCGFIVLVLTFTYLLMSNGYGYVLCANCGRQLWYIRWAAFTLVVPGLMMIACDFSLFGLQVKIDGPRTNFGDLLNVFLSDDTAKEVATGLGFVKAILLGTFSASEGNGLKLAWMSSSFLMFASLTFATIVCRFEQGGGG